MKKKVRIFGKDLPAFIVISAMTIFVCGLFVVLLSGLANIRNKQYLEMVNPVWGEIPNNLEFKFALCRDAGPYFTPRIEKEDWINEDTLRIQIAVPVNCAANGFLGNYEIEEENRILLKYITIRTNGEAACICRAELEYQISDISVNEYSSNIIDLGIITPSGYYTNNE